MLNRLRIPKIHHLNEVCGFGVLCQVQLVSYLGVLHLCTHVKQAFNGHFNNDYSYLFLE